MRHPSHPHGAYIDPNARQRQQPQTTSGNPQSTSNGQQPAPYGGAAYSGNLPISATRLPDPPRAPTPSPAPYIGLPTATPYKYVPPVQVYSTPPTPEWTAPPEAYSSVAWNPTPPWTPMTLPHSNKKDNSSGKIGSYFDPRASASVYHSSHSACPPDPAESCLFAGSSVDPTKKASTKRH
ncbi:unnamed protein product [Cyclocybe aegerita]|uniref:Uncharacterized protein n=1 Tax=Cyclocybe aegerita TaxID=1973307 RepID=A0A8S0X351_CYCAE|nr:unnamed protein product [Cyclocybe aegerita]